MFKRIRKFYKNNRIYCILMFVSVFCIITLGTALVLYFVNQATSDPYGKRLEHLDTKGIKEVIKECDKYLEDEKIVNSAKVFRQGPIIYVYVDVDPKTSIDEMQNLGISSLEKFNEEQKEQYEIQFSFTREGSIPYTGSKGISKSVITWGNYKTTETTTTKTTKKK